MTPQFRFGDVLIDQQSFRLLRAGKPRAIEPKALHVLIFLVQNQGRLIERRELLTAIWGDAFVTDHVLNRSIGQLRKVLGDDAKEPRYIETVPTLGYRFIAAVEMDTLEAPRAASEGSMPVVAGEPYEPPPPIAPIASSQVGRSNGGQSDAENAVVSDTLPDRALSERELIPAKRSWSAAKRWAYGIGLAAAIVAATEFLSKTPLASAPLESTQITFSMDIKERPMFTDGSRLYFERRGEPSEMAVTGGPVVPMRALEPGMHLRDVSADGSKLLAWKNDLNDGGSLWVDSTVGGALRKLRDHMANLAIWSPDGHAIVTSIGPTLYGMDESGGSFRKLWEAPGPVTDLFFSPDGKQLCVTFEMEYVSRIWMVRSDGTHAHPLEVEWPDNRDLRNGRWTPNGRHFVFRSDGEGRQNMYEVIKPDWLHFWRKPKAIRITGNQIDILASVPSRTTDGLFVLGRLDQGAMQVFDPKRKTFVPFLNGFSAESFAISPDGQWMAYSEHPSFNLWKSRLDGSAARQLTDAPAIWQHWSPDGKWIVYGDSHTLHRVSADGGPVENLLPMGSHGQAPTWSPDGKSVVFSDWDILHEPEGLFVLDIATHNISPMAGAQHYHISSWSPNGKYLVAIADKPARMMMYSAESRNWSVLKVFDGPWGLYTWSPDSKSIYMAVIQDHKGIFRLSVPDGAWDKVAGLENIDSRPGTGFVSVTADNQPVIMSHTGVSQLYLLRWPH